MKPLSELNQYRDRAMEAKLGMTKWSEHDDKFGFFRVKTSGHPKALRVAVSRFREDEPESDNNPPWNHISVSLPNRTPTWAEMEHIKKLFFEPHEVAMQLHVAESDHISNHDFCLHIWQPATLEIPTPPAYMVGVKELGDITPRKRK